MEERATKLHIIRAADPEKLIVYKAESSKDEIRFYFNETEYIKAFEKDDEWLATDFGEDVTSEESKEKTSTRIKEKLKMAFKIAILCLVVLVMTALCFAMVAYTASILCFLIAMNLIMFTAKIGSVIILESQYTLPEVKSKHSAEHMMVNFLEKNKRLPQNAQEVRNSSRFSTNCGSRRLIKGSAEELISKISAIILTGVASDTYAIFSENIVGKIIVTTVVYFLSIVAVAIFLKRSEKAKFLIKPLERVLTNIAQLGNTTRKVSEKDIALAYMAARIWLKKVYPEFYKEEDDALLDDDSD